jgi:XTP/dITP diphosphohydrolase/tetrapyrrole methylase family protein/MazG family protein/ATP diphosphatase
MPSPGGAVERLDEVTRRLRRECPWDREQDERSIVPHTVEEAYELADAAHAGDDEKLVDELGDVLFQVYFLSLLLEERDAGNLAEVADRCREKLIRRHPHVFGDASVETAEGVVRQWDEIKRDDERGGALGDLPESLPATLLAMKARRRAARTGGVATEPPQPAGASERLREAGDEEERFERAGELMFAAVAAAADAGADPELALRAAVDRYVQRVGKAQAT